ncbi:MAG: hypothetical protein RIQ54_174, partial [Candidatus Parcubacteria bacterium]|jgi:hypothetical protein
MKLYEVVYESIYGKKFFETIEDRPFSFSLSYAIALACITGTIIAITYGLIIIPGLNDLAAAVSDTLEQQIPEHILVRVSDGRASISPSEKTVIAPAPSLRQFFSDRDITSIQTFALVDPMATPESVKQEKAFIGISQTNIMIADANNTILTQALTEIPNFTFTKQTAADAARELRAMRAWTAPIVMVSLFILWIALGAVYVITLLPVSILVWGYGVWRDKQNKKKGAAQKPNGILATRRTIKKCYQILMHASTFGVMFMVVVALVVPDLLVLYVLVGLPLSAILIVARAKELPSAPADH